MTMLSNALALADAAHRGAKKRGTDLPMLYHPMAVASLVLQYGGDDEQAAAALLHDTLGDETTPESYRQDFGDRVVSMLASFVDPPMTIASPTWREVRSAYVAKLATLDAEHLLVVACEELHDLSQLVHDLEHRGEAAWKRFDTTQPDVHWYVSALESLFERRLGHAALVAEFRAARRRLG